MTPVGHQCLELKDGNWLWSWIGTVRGPEWEQSLLQNKQSYTCKKPKMSLRRSNVVIARRRHIKVSGLHEKTSSSLCVWSWGLMFTDRRSNLPTFFLCTTTSLPRSQWGPSQRTKMSTGWRCCWRRAAVWRLLLNECCGNGRARLSAGHTVRAADLRTHQHFLRISYHILTCEDFSPLGVFLCRDRCLLTSLTVFFIIGHEW